MRDWVRYRYELRRAQLANRQELNLLHEEYRKARKDSNSREQIDEIFSRILAKARQYQDEQASVQTSYLCDLAVKRLIPIPDMSDATVLGKPEPSSKWRRRTDDARLVLTDEALRELRLALRADRRERLEIVRSWVATIVPGLTGLIGVIIGLLAVILGRR
jgi:hypothetical protein